MKDSKQKKNIIISAFSYIVTTVTAILIPRLIMVNLGSEANGLLLSINQILAYLGLMEAGVGTVTVQALYKPVAEGDRSGINGILAATQKYYCRTGMFYLAAVAVLSLVYPFLVKTELPRSTVIAVALLSGSAGALNYFFHGKYSLLLQAEGKQYIVTGIFMVIHVLMNLAKVTLLLCGLDVIAVQTAYLLAIALQSCAVCLYVRRHYKWLDMRCKPNEKAIDQKHSVLLHQICGLIFGNTDSVLLTVTWGLKYVSIYAVYSMIISQLGTLVGIPLSGFMYSLGQKYQTDFERFKEEFGLFEFGIVVLTFLLGSVCAVMIVPFVKLYTAGVTDVDYQNALYPVLFLAVFLLSNIRLPAQTAITVAGHFKNTTKQAVFETGINILVSLTLLKRFGIVGVLIGSVAALLYRTNDMIVYSAKMIHKRSIKTTYLRLLRNFALFLVFCFWGWLAPISCSSFFAFVLWGTAVSVVAAVVFAGVNALCERDTAASVWSSVCKRKSSFS